MASLLIDSHSLLSILQLTVPVPADQRKRRLRSSFLHSQWFWSNIKIKGVMMNFKSDTNSWYQYLIKITGKPHRIEPKMWDYYWVGVSTCTALMYGSLLVTPFLVRRSCEPPLTNWTFGSWWSKKKSDSEFLKTEWADPHRSIQKIFQLN